MKDYPEEKTIEELEKLALYWHDKYEALCKSIKGIIEEVQK
jgi:hypothetical protein